jgi:hypothetical protein
LNLTIQQLSIPAPFIPSSDEIVFLWLKAWPAWLMNPGPLWRLLQLKLDVTPLPTQPHLARNVGYVHLFGEKAVDLVLAFDPLLMVLVTLLCLADAACRCAREPWAQLPARNCSSARYVRL